MTVAELLGRISSHELAEWQAFFMLESQSAEAKAKSLVEDEQLKARANKNLKG